MVPHTPDSHPKPPTTAVVQVAEDGTATLYLGTEPVEHAKSVDPATIMRILMDYAAALGTSLRVTTQMPDGTWTRRWLDAFGSMTDSPPDTSVVKPQALKIVKASRKTSGSPRPAVWRARVVSRAPIIIVVALLLASVLAVASIYGPY